MLDTNAYDRYQDEEPSIHRLITERKRQYQIIQEICDANGSYHQTSKDILRVFAEHYRRKYYTIPIHAEAMHTLLGCNTTQIPDDANEQLDETISMDELPCYKKSRETTKITRPRRHSTRILQD
jgi:hypothetical protein